MVLASIIYPLQREQRRQLSIFLLVNIFAEKGHFEDEKTDLTSLLYGIYKIPWNKMRVLNEDLELDFTSHTERYDKLIIDLVSTHLVHMLKMIPTDSSRTIPSNAKVVMEKAVSRTLTECQLVPSDGAVNFVCLAVGRKLTVLKKPDQVNLEIHGREVLIENYVGCFETKNLEDVTRETNEVNKSDSARECAVLCRDKSSYFGLDSREKCTCIEDISNIVSIKTSLCENVCSNKLYFCGSKSDYISMYSTNNTRAKHSLNPASYNCLNDFSGCGPCPTGKKGYNCEFVDCSVENGDCASKCSEVKIMDEQFGFCKCREGFYGEASDCKDFNECRDFYACPDDRFCTNTVGSFTCDCLIGRIKDEFGNCTDIDECQLINKCDLSSTECINFVGSYFCQCLSGFKKYSIANCLDINECQADNGCDPNSTECVNLPGSYRCSCLRGYKKMNWFKCADEDECHSLGKKCPEGVSCINLPGSYDCVCPEGTNKIDFVHVIECDDIDECDIPDKCDETSSFCINTLPFYVCACRQGYASVDNFTCNPKDTNDTEESTVLMTTENPDHNLEQFYLSLAVVLLSLIVILILLSFCFGKDSYFLESRRYSTATSTSEALSM